MAGKTLNLEVIVDADNKGFKKVMGDSVRQAKGSAKQIEKGFGGIGGSIGQFAKNNVGTFLGGAALLGAIRSTTEYAGKITDLSDALNLGGEEFQRFAHAFKLAGGDEDVFTKGMAGLTEKLEDARNGGEESREQFKKLGFTLYELADIQADEAILKIADALKKSGGDARVTAQVMDLLGNKIALKLIPALKNGRAEFIAAGNSAKVMSDQSRKALDDAGDRWDTFKSSAMASGGEVFAGAIDGAERLVYLLDALMAPLIKIDSEAGGKLGSIMAGVRNLAGVKTGPAMDHPTMEEAMGNATMMDPVTTTGFWQTKRPEFTGARWNAERFGPSMSGDPVGGGGFNGFSSGYFPGSGGGLTSGGLSSGGLSSGGLGRGKGSDAWGKVRRGDARRAKDAASASGKDPQLEDIKKNTSEMVKVWTGGKN